MTAPHSPTKQAETKQKLDLNLTQVAGAALAAVTTAVVGSELGTAGTLIGAAGASVISTVGTAVYRTSLERSRQRVRSLAHRPRPSTASAHKADSPNADLPMADLSMADLPKAEPSHRSRRSTALRWGAVIVGSVGAFLLAMAVITGFEWADGQTVGGNGKGTTIGQVINDQPAVPKRTDPGAPAASETPTATPTPTPTSTAPGGILPGIVGGPTSTVTPEPSPTTTSDRPTPREGTPVPSLIPPVLPGGGG